jgi:hypothetical protein
MKRLITPLLIASPIIFCILFFNGTVSTNFAFAATPPKIDSIIIDPSACKANCERSKIWSSLHRHTENENGMISDISVSNMSMTFEKAVGIKNGYFLLKNSIFNGGTIHLNLTDALEPKVFPKGVSRVQMGYLKIIRMDTLGNDSLNRRVTADFHAGDTTGRISFPAMVTYSDAANQKPSRLKGNFVIDALTWKLFPVDTTAVITKDELNFIIDIVSKK